MFVSIKTILPSVSERVKTRGEAEIYHIRKKWEEIVAILPRKGAGLTPFSFKKGILIVRCANTSWANELQFWQKDLIKRINKILREKKIKQIKFAY